MQDLSAAFWRAETPYVLGGALLLALLLLQALKDDRATIARTLLLFGALLLLDLLQAGLARSAPWGLARGLLLLVQLGYLLVLFRLICLALFRWLLPALRRPLPRIVEDVVLISGYLLLGMVSLSRAGVELNSLVATSAVVTAVIAFAMQDTLGNILGGLALQGDNSLKIGSWVKLDDVTGRVVEIHWRYTAILTRNGERVVVPNAVLMKNKFIVIDPREDGAASWRRWIWFHIDYAVPPSRVIAAAEHAVIDADIGNVAREPAPSCVAADFTPGALRYALRYWLIDPRDDDPTDSAVRAHLLAAVQRQGWRIALPDQVVHQVIEGESHREAVRQQELAQRLKALAGVDLFSGLSADEHRQLAERLRPTPFASGDVMTRQGAQAHWLYIIASGQADVWWEAPDGERRRVATLSSGSVFGEMGLMTGEPRSATVVARGDVDCYRLDKAGFEVVLHQRHEIAEHMARVLAQRLQFNATLRDDYLKEVREPPPQDADILGRMRRFFGLDEPAPR